MASKFGNTAKTFGLGAKEVLTCWWKHNLARSAAAVAFYCLFSMVPILVIATQLAGVFIGYDRAQNEVGQAARMMFDEEARDYLQGLLKARPAPVFTSISSIFGSLVLLFTASKVVVELREVLTVVFGTRVREGKKGAVVKLLLGRLVPVLLVLALGGLLAISAIADAVMQFVARELENILTVNLMLLEITQSLVTLAFIVLIFALILRWLPPRPPSFRNALVGAFVAGGLFAVTKGLISFYFSQSDVIGVYGAGVTLVVVLLWLYFTIQIFFLGAETAAYICRKSGTPSADPVSLK